MNEDQKRAVEMALHGHSFLLTGQAGTGKTFTTIQIIKELKKMKKKVLVCAYTGIACTQFLQGDFQAQTVNRMFGLKDGRYTHQQLSSLFMDNDPYYVDRKQKIKEADVLIIDEISMVSARTLASVDHVCQLAKQSKSIMGGLQIICVGDFLQLPPVPDRTVNDPGHYAFQHESFRKIVTHSIELILVRF